MNLSNDYKDCRIYDLDPANLRTGPYLVTQTGLDPLDLCMEEKLFILRQDGIWVEYSTQYIRHPDEIQKLCFDTMGEIMSLLESLSLEVNIERAEMEASQLEYFRKQVEQAGGLLAFIQHEIRRLAETKSRPSN